jgi:hypothetical protein
MTWETVAAICWDWRFVIIVVLGVAIFAILEWNKFKTLAYQAMLTAKSLAKDYVLKSGKEQEDWVIIKMYTVMPKLNVVPEDKLRIVIHWLFIKAKDLVDDGKLNDSEK